MSGEIALGGSDIKVCQDRRHPGHRGRNSFRKEVIVRPGSVVGRIQDGNISNLRRCNPKLTVNLIKSQFTAATNKRQTNSERSQTGFNLIHDADMGRKTAFRNPCVRNLMFLC